LCGGVECVWGGGGGGGVLGGGGGDKCLKVKVSKVKDFSVFLPAKKKMRKISVLGIKNNRGPGARPPWFR